MGLSAKLPLRARLLRVIRPDWFKEHASDPNNLLLRCDCGDLLWMNSPQRVQAEHLGHGFKRPATSGTWQELVRINRGLVP